MPYVREGIPGPGLFPMIIGGMLIILGALVILTALMSARRDRIHGQQLAAAEAQAPPGEPGAPSAETDGAAKIGRASGRERLGGAGAAQAVQRDRWDDVQATGTR